MKRAKNIKGPDYSKCIGDFRALQRKLTVLKRDQEKQSQDQKELERLIESLSAQVEEIAGHYQRLLVHLEQLEKETSSHERQKETLCVEINRLAAAIAATSTGECRIVSARSLAISRSVLEEEIRYFTSRYLDALRARAAITGHTDNPVCHRHVNLLLTQREEELREFEVQILDGIAVDDEFDPEFMESIESTPAPEGHESLVGKVARVDSPAFKWHDSSAQPQVIPAKVATFSIPTSQPTVAGISIDAQVTDKQGSEVVS